MSEHNYRFGVKMTCGGCTKSVNNLLTTFQGKTPGVKSFNVSLSESPQDKAGLVEVVTDDTVDYNTVLAAVKRSGKAVESGTADGQQMSITI